MGIQSVQTVWFDFDNQFFAAAVCSTDIRFPLWLVKKSKNYWAQDYLDPTSARHCFPT